LSYATTNSIDRKRHFEKRISFSHIVGSLVQVFYAATEMMLGQNGMKNSPYTPFSNKRDLDRENGVF
jgi:triphosphoribosyl-dephospho-CoA synthetase